MTTHTTTPDTVNPATAPAAAATGSASSSTPVAAPPGAGRWSHRLRTAAERYALLGLTVLTAAFFCVLPASSAVFPTIANVNVILGSQSVTALIAIAALFTLISGYFDFSLGGNTAMCSVLAAGLMSFSHWPLWAAIVASVVLGTLIGFVNGLLVAYFELDAFVATLGMATLLGGIILWYTNSATIFNGIDPSLAQWGATTFAGLPLVVYVVAVVAVLAWYVLQHTPYGRSLAAIGANPKSARLVGLRLRRDVWLGFTIAGFTAGVTGIIYLSRTGSATSDPGTSLIFPALAAVFLGATSIRPGFFNVAGTIIGVVFVAIAVSGLTLAGATSWASPVFNGLALIVAVGLSTYLRKRRRLS